MGPIEVLDFFKFILCLAGVFILALAIRSFTRTYDPRYREAMVFWDLLNKKIDEYLDERVIPLSEWEELRKMAEFADTWIDHRTGKYPFLTVRIDTIIKTVSKRTISLR